jgi:hypothetical protein
MEQIVSWPPGQRNLFTRSRPQSGMLTAESSENDAVHWHKCEVPTILSNVRFRGDSGRLLLGLSSSQFDPSETLSLITSVADGVSLPPAGAGC